MCLKTPRSVKDVFIQMCFEIACVPVILLMEEILHHLGCMKPVNNVIFTTSIGAGFLPATACSEPSCLFAYYAVFHSNPEKSSLFHMP